MQTPTTQPELLIFDGDCGFCTTSARWAERRIADSVAVVPWQSVNLDAFGLTQDDVTTAMYWVDGSQRPHRGHRGVGFVLRAIAAHYQTRSARHALQSPPASALTRTRYRLIGWLARIGALLCLAPGTSIVADYAYRLVARNRHRLPGATAACQLPPPTTATTK